MVMSAKRMVSAPATRESLGNIWVPLQSDETMSTRLWLERISFRYRSAGSTLCVLCVLCVLRVLCVHSDDPFDDRITCGVAPIDQPCILVICAFCVNVFPATS